MRSRVRHLLAALALLAVPALAGAQDLIAVNDRPFLELVGGVEAGSGYDTVTARTGLRPPLPLTEMTIREVIAFQDEIIASGASSSAAGKYQIIRDTLEWLTDRHGVDPDTVFDRVTQDYLARLILIRCGFYDRYRDLDALGNCLAQAWAGLPVMSGKREGKSWYPGNGNKSLTTTAAVRSVLLSRFPPKDDTIVISLSD